VVARSAPVALPIPVIGVAVSVSALGLSPDGTVQVPTDFQEPGWFRLRPSPGQVGSAVILGHVDSYQGPAVLTGCGPKEQFPARRVYGSHGYSALQLVTCGGTFDTHTRSYLSNVVAYTSLVATIPADATAGRPARIGQAGRR
jgi:hypothetical protein